MTMTSTIDSSAQMTASDTNGAWYLFGNKTETVSNCYVTPTLWQTWYPVYQQDKVSVSFRIVKHLMDKGLVREKDLTIKKFMDIVEEIVKVL